MGNGPSLSKTTEILKLGIPSFGCNLIFENEWGFIPDFYVTQGFEQLKSEEYVPKYIEALLMSSAGFVTEYAPAADEAYRVLEKWEHVYPLTSRDEDGKEIDNRVDRLQFSFEPEKRVGIGASAVYTMFQLAYYMGFSTAVCVGLDHDYALESGPHFYTSPEPRPDIPIPHSGSKWQMEASIAFRIAGNVWTKDRREILNLTPGTMCRGLKRGDYSEWCSKLKQID